ncbi:uncharacterized protein METZ01_LOCUS510292, partial [marine metagenome]
EIPKKLSQELTEAFTPLLESPTFIKWFKGSKVVDKNNKPLLVYHGTNTDIKKFSTEHNIRKAIWFTDSAKDAAEWAVWGKGEAGNNIIPAYVSLKDPLISTNAHDLSSPES